MVSSRGRAEGWALEGEEESLPKSITTTMTEYLASTTRLPLSLFKWKGNVLRSLPLKQEGIITAGISGVTIVLG